jgi:hypothetical protein
MIEERENGFKSCDHVEFISTRSHDLTYCSHSQSNNDLTCYNGYIAEIIGRSKNCPNE